LKYFTVHRRKNSNAKLVKAVT